MSELNPKAEEEDLLVSRLKTAMATNPCSSPFAESLYHPGAAVCGFLIFSCAKPTQLKRQKEPLVKRKGKTTTIISGQKIYSWKGKCGGMGGEKGEGRRHTGFRAEIHGFKADLSKTFREKMDF